MEGGQKKAIPLDSELDVKSSDQLVPVDRPKFQHNRQRFQGSTLPTSLRFEHNGVAAGWDVYEFEVNYLTVDTSPARFTVMRQQINSNPTYVFRLRIGTTTYAMVYWNGEDVVKAGDLEIAHGEGTDFATVTLKGDNDGHELVLTIDMVSGDFKYEASDWYLIESNYLDATALNGQTDISLLDLTNWVEFNAAVVPPQDAIYSGKKIASYYSCVEQDDGTHLHTWSDPLADNAWIVTYCPETDTVLVNGEEAEHTFNSANGQLAITYSTEYSAVIDVKVIGEVFYFQIYGLSVNQVQQYVTPAATGMEDFEYWAAHTDDNSMLYPSSLCPAVTIAGYIPFWSGLRISFSNDSSNAAIALMEMTLSSGTTDATPPDGEGIVSASVWFLSGDYVSFYEANVGGVDLALYEGEQLLDSSALSEGVNTFGTKTDVYGSLTYCVCVFNRVRILEEDDGTQIGYSYDYPFSAGYGDTGSLEYNNNEDDGERRASWFEGGTFTAYDGKSYEFEAGFYVPMERRADDEIYKPEDEKTDNAEPGYIAFPSGWPSGIATGYEGSFIHYEKYNALLEEHSEALVEAGYDTTPLTEEDAPYWYCTDAAWDISSEYVGTHHDDHYADADVIWDDRATQREESGYDEDNETALYEDVSYKQHMRLGWPYAFYDTSVQTAEWLGTRYLSSNVQTDSEAGQAAIDMRIYVVGDTYRDVHDEFTYSMGGGFASGTQSYFLQPYFRSVADSSDSRELVHHEDNVGFSSNTGSVTQSYSASIVSGMLSGLGITYLAGYSGYTTGTVYGNQVENPIDGVWYGWDKLESSAYGSAYNAMLAKKQELIDAGYVNITFSSVKYQHAREGNSWGDTSGGTNKKVRGYYTYSYYVTYTQSCSLSYAESDIWASSSSSSSTDITEALQTVWEIPPLYAGIYSAGLGSTHASLAGSINASVCIAACFKGNFQYELGVQPVGGDELAAFTDSNIDSLIALSRSSVVSSYQGLYIDREIAGASDGSLQSYIGYELVELHLKELSIDSGRFSAKLFFTPKFDESSQEYGTYYVHRGTVSGEDVYIPGHILDGTLTSLSTGKNLVGTQIGYTYTTSQLTFSVDGDVVSFFKANSAEVAWPLSTGTHDFYSDTLPSAVKALAFGYMFYGSVESSYGKASASQNINLYFDEANIRLNVSFSQADDTGTTTVTQTVGTDAIDFNGYSFTFDINKAEWDESGQEVSLRVTVPLTYEIVARPPYQYNYDTLEYDEESGLYTVDGDGENRVSAVPVGSLAVGFDPTEMQYKFLTATDDPYTYYFLKNTGEFKYGLEKFESAQVGEARCAAIEGYEYLEYSFILEGAYRTYKCTVRSFDEENITVSYDGTDYTFPYSDLMTDEEPDEMNFMYTDTRDEQAIPDTVTFARQNFEKEFQFLRQTWETTNEVENYWWIDEETILELSKTSLTVKKKKVFDDYAEEATVDDWGGDFWEDAASFPRYEYLDNTVARYGVTNAYGDGEERPRFWTIKEVSNTKLKITFYALVETDYGTYTGYVLEDVSTTVTLNQVEIGSVLNNPSYDRMNTYSQLSVESIIYDSQFSATVIGQHILFGIHNDNNFNQWALDISTTGELLQVVQGYGFVGVNGCLTGGEIPSAWFDPSIGFTGTVQPIDAIEQEEAVDVTTPEEFTNLDCGDIVVGDESQQWYVSKKISSIVSHLLWDEEAEMWGTEVLYLNNNLEQVYGSASFGANVLSENGLNYHNFFTELAEHIDCSGLSDTMDVIGKIGTCYFVYYSPRLTTMLYLQQTMGQYAYVHYNTTSPNKQIDQGRVNFNREASEKWYGKEGIKGASYNASGTVVEEMDENWVEPATPNDEDDFSFNLHTLRQQLYIDNCWAGVGFALMYLLIQAGMSLSDSLSGIVDSKASGKSWKDSAKSAVKQFGQMASQNALNLTSLDMGVLGNIPTQNSAVTGVLTLDMFYSTSEGQAIQAGPGFVQHNFQAQCVAQSVTSNQMELKQIGAFISLSELGTLAYKVAELALRYIADAAIGGAAILASGGDSAGVMGTTAAATAVVALATKYAVQILLDICEVVDKLFRAIASNVPPAQALNMRSSHAFDMEGKHKYGQKSEIFMWPCWGVNTPIEYENESVEAVCQNVPWRLSVPTGAGGEIGGGDPETSGSVLGLDADSVTYNVGSDITLNFSGEVPYMAASCKGKTETTQCPENMAAIIGCESFLPPVPFRNEGIGVKEPQFVEQIIQDYMIDEEWELSMTCSRGMISWVSCRDTKLINGAPSNVVVYDDFCGVASPYTAIEIKRGYEQKYMRAWAVTPMAVGVNQSGLNAAYEEKAYHAFDGYGGRIVKWCGSSGMNKEGVVHQYAFIANDRFKRSNKVGANTLYGNFGGEPILALRTIGEDEVYNNVERDTRERMGFAGIPGEDKDGIRYAMPVFAETVSVLPAVMRTISAFNLAVVDGITGLVSANVDAQSRYKAPVSIDFAIGHKKYRFTDEYINELEVDPKYGVTTVKELVPTLGLTYLGATPYEAYLYSSATRQYYTYAGGTSLNAIDTVERFRDVLYGRYDFVNQEVVLPCVATFDRLDKHVHDDEDERDNTMVPRLKDGKFVGEVWPPIETIWNMRSGFKTISLPSGICFQGPNRCVINRFVYSDYMKSQIIENRGQWARVPRERYHPFRVYEDEYVKVDDNPLVQIVGWTHNPFLLVTSPLGVNSETDCLFEWEITFAWPVEMDGLYSAGQYLVVNVMAETFTPGGKVVPERPAHVFLTRDLFTRTGNYGYYSYRYQSRCGAGNRERLHIWSDQYICVSSLQLEYKPITQKRTEILTQAVDVQLLEEP